MPIVKKSKKTTKTQQRARPNPVEKRLSDLEKQVASLRSELKRLVVQDENWIGGISGSMKDNPAFEEAMRLGAEIRRADRPSRDE